MPVVAETNIASLVQRREGVNGGRPCLAGTGFSVHQLSVHFNEGLSPEAILDEYPHLDLTRIYAGITYYLANRDWIDAEIEAESKAYWDEVARQEQAALGHSL